MGRELMIPISSDVSIKRFMGTPCKVFQPLNKLKPKHLRIIALHMQGYAGLQIVNMLAEAKVFFSLGRVYAVINDPLSQELMKKFYAGAEVELQALEGMAVHVLRDAMMNGSHRDAISAADKIFKVRGKYGSSEGRDSAEDVIARAMDAVKASSEAVKEVVRQRPSLIDITPSKVIENG